MKPKVGDVWEIKFPNKKKVTKTIRSIHRSRTKYKDSRGRQRSGFSVDFDRQPKGRYYTVKMRGLLRFGKLIKRKD